MFLMNSVALTTAVKCNLLPWPFFIFLTVTKCALHSQIAQIASFHLQSGFPTSSPLSLPEKSLQNLQYAASSSIEYTKPSYLNSSNQLFENELKWGLPCHLVPNCCLGNWKFSRILQVSFKICTYQYYSFCKCKFGYSARCVLRCAVVLLLLFIRLFYKKVIHI